jgi:hypothetical protein
MTHLKSIPRNIPESTLCRVGAIAVLWGAIDHYIDQLIWQLIGLDLDAGRELTVTMRTSAKRRTLTALMHKSGNASAGARAVVSEALKLVGKVEDHRDLMMHALWFPNEETNVPEASSFKMRGERAGTWKAEKFSDTRLDSIITDLESAHRVLGRFAEARDHWQLTSPQIRASLSLVDPYIPT